MTITANQAATLSVLNALLEVRERLLDQRSKCCLNSDQSRKVVGLVQQVDDLFNDIYPKSEPAQAGFEELVRASLRVARLNPNAGEIGDDMLRTIIEEARYALKAAGEDDEQAT